MPCPPECKYSLHLVPKLLAQSESKVNSKKKKRLEKYIVCLPFP